MTAPIRPLYGYSRRLSSVDSTDASTSSDSPVMADLSKRVSRMFQPVEGPQALCSNLETNRKRSGSKLSLATNSCESAKKKMGRGRGKKEKAKKIEFVRTADFILYLSSHFPCRIAAPCPRPVLRVGSSNYDGHRYLT